MLKGISPLVSPELLLALCSMGHGDEIVLADAHFPGGKYNDYVIRADGLKIGDLLDGILPLFELDSHGGSALLMMAASGGDVLDPDVEARYRSVIDKHCPDARPIERLDRFEFYDRATQAYAVLMTGDTAAYGNIILRKGVTPC